MKTVREGLPCPCFSLAIFTVSFENFGNFLCKRGVGIIFCKEPDSKYFRLKFYGLFCNNSTLQPEHESGRDNP